MSKKIIAKNLIAYGTMHALVDAICFAIVFYIWRNELGSVAAFVKLILLYDILAFGLQVFLGLLVDYLKSPRLSVLSGAAFLILAMLSINNPVLAVVLAGIGNALFHIGAGTVVFNLMPQKATALGLFVAPGAIGVFAGTLIGQRGYFSPWYLIVALAVFCLYSLKIETPKIDYGTTKKTYTYKNFCMAAILLILFTVSIRSFIGFALIFPWKINFSLAISLVGVTALGKAFGGIIADKFGLLKTGVISLLISAPLLAFGAPVFPIAILGVFLFNFTMPITLFAIYKFFPGRPGFSFGLTCLALLFGVLPVFYGAKFLGAYSWFMLAIIVISTVTLYYGLKSTKRKIAGNGINSDF